MLVVLVGAFIVLAIGGGLRREEVADATIAGLKGDMLSIVGKGNRQRKIFLEPSMRRVLDVWLCERERLAPTHDNLFCSPLRPNHELSKWSFWVLVREAAHRAFGTEGACAKGCPCLEVLTGPHDFRRTFVTHLYREGLDTREIQKLAGHASPETTVRYDKRGEEELMKKRRTTRVIA